MREQRGPPNDYADFVATAYPSLLRYGYLLTGDLGAARELTQTALARVWPRWDSLRDAAAAGAYVRKTMATSLVSSVRRHRVRQVPLDAVTEPAVSDPAEALAEHADLWSAIQSLPSRQRAAVVVRYFGDLPVADVAARLGCSSRTAAGELRAALIALRVTTRIAAPDDPLRNHTTTEQGRSS